MRAALSAAVLILAACAPAGGPSGAFEQHDDPVLDRYRSENFLDIDRPGGIGVETGARRSVPAAGAPSTADLHLRVETGSVALCARTRRRADAAWEAYHGAWSPVKGIRVLAGDFVPDVGIGLVSSARRFAGSFTASWPAVGTGLKRWTGFYDTFVRGGAVSLASGPVSLSILAGVPGAHRTGGTAAGGGRLAGMRATAAGQAAAAGVCVFHGAQDAGPVSCSLEGVALAGPAALVGELSLAGGRAGAAWGCVARSRSVRAAALLYHAPGGSTGPFAHLPGATRRRDASRTGFGAALRARFPGRCVVEASVERRQWRDGYEEVGETDARLKLELRRRAGSLSLSLREERGEETDCLPVPPPPSAGARRSRSAELVANARAGTLILGRCALRIVCDERSSGRLAAAGVRTGPWMRGMRIDAGWSRCLSTRGRAVFRFHEPSVPGVYSWKTISGEGTRLYMVFLVRIRALSVSASVCWQDRTGAGGETSIRMNY